MFFQEIYSVQESIQHIKSKLFVNIQTQLDLLQFRLDGTHQEDKGTQEVAHSILIFRQEFDSLQRLFNMVLVPAVQKCLSDSNCAQPFNGFTVLRSTHEKQRKVLDDLRRHCDSFILQENWSEEKKGQCLTTFNLHQAFLQYLNFCESTLIPLLKNLHERASDYYES